MCARNNRLVRFEREPKAVAALSHPNILAIYDFGAHEGTTYAVTGLLEGESLRTWNARLFRSIYRSAVEPAALAAAVVRPMIATVLRAVSSQRAAFITTLVIASGC